MISISNFSYLIFLIHPEWDSGTSVHKGEPIKIKNDYDLFLTRIIITKDDILRYSDKIPECKRARLKEPIVVDIYI